MKPEILQVTAIDGLVHRAALLLPEGEGPFPGAVVVHGGMGGLSDGELHQTATNPSAPPQRLLRQGYAVLVSDYRHPSLARLEADDTVAAYHALCDHPQVDAGRVALVGTSHGAVCVLYAGMRVRPACIVAEEGSTDLAYRHEVLFRDIWAHSGALDGYIKLDKELFDELAARMGGTPDEVPEAWERASGPAHAHEIQSPVLILSGDGDYMPHCLTMAAALVKAEKDCQLVLCDDAPHAFWWRQLDIPAFARADDKVTAFLARHLRP